MDDKGKDFVGCSSNVLYRNERCNVVHCTEENWPSVVLSLSQVISNKQYYWLVNHLIVLCKLVESISLS